MKYPSFKEEKKLWRKGYKWVAGLDEAGRGPLAGPVVATAVCFRIFNFHTRLRGTCSFPIFNKFTISNFQKLKYVRDSKQLSPRRREEIFNILTKHPQIKWGIGRVSEKVIDKINILEATKLAMQKAIKDLNCRPGYLILDGSFKIKSKIPQKSIIKADEKVFSCAAASIIAKVTRDRIMLNYDKKYPKYGFKKHKGYPTKLHRKKIKKFGPCPIHRKSFSWE